MSAVSSSRSSGNWLARTLREAVGDVDRDGLPVGLAQLATRIERVVNEAGGPKLAMDAAQPERSRRR